jgi:predicted TIM-barrel fold metal-dependent hydrolase
MRAAGLAALLADTGYPPGAMPLGQMAALLGCPVHEVVRVESRAEALLPQGLSCADYLAAVRADLAASAARAVALKSVIAYRTGLAVQAWEPGETAAAYAAATARLRAGGPARLTDKPLLDALFLAAVQVARDTGRPLQVHAGWGDPDVDLPRANPVLLRPILEDPRSAALRLVVLHQAYPYVREAAFMAAVWPQVHVDLSLALPFLGGGAVGPLVELLALAPASKLMYGSDVHSLPELIPLAAEWGRAALAEALGWLVARGDVTAVEARARGAAILADNARRLYLA